jgi:hypothetical protein
MTTVEIDSPLDEKKHGEERHKEQLRRHRDFLETTRLTISRDRDKMVLAVAGGSLTVTVALLEKLAINIGRVQATVLALGWGAEVWAIVLILRSLTCSERALYTERERVDCMISGKGDDPEWKNPDMGQTEKLNTRASILAVVGVVLLLIQAAIGLSALKTP